MRSVTRIINGNIITAGGIIRSGTVVIDGGLIAAVEQAGHDRPGGTVIDARGNYVSPGFIDMHVHGGGGQDFMDGTIDAFLRIAETHACFGTTAMTPTTVSSDKKDILEVLNIYRRAKPLNVGARFLGMHLEGPYFSLTQKGAQDERFIKDPDPEEYKSIVALSSDIIRWTAAPELKGSLDFAGYLRSKGIVVALGHTDATFEETVTAFDHGFSLATHFYSCMSGVTRKNGFRHAGVIEAGYLIDGMDVEVIADGVHCPPPLLQLICKIKSSDRIALVTDAMRAAGTHTTTSVLGGTRNGIPVIIEDGVAKLPDRSSFAGSIATADQLVRTMTRQAGVSLGDAVRMMTANPARIMGVSDHKGDIAPGKDADLLIFDKNISIQTTIIGGNIVYHV